jgi:hypothetical protein
MASQSKRVAELGDGRSRESRIGHAGTRVAGDTVDVVGAQTGISDRTHNCFERQLQTGAAEAPPYLRLAGTGDDSLAVEWAASHHHRLVTCQFGEHVGNCGDHFVLLDRDRLHLHRVPGAIEQAECSDADDLGRMVVGPSPSMS